MATIRKRNNKYQVQVRIKGLSTTATLITLDHARRWARQKELELESKLKLGELYRPKNFKEIILRYKQKVTPLKKSSHNETIIIESLARNLWMLIPLDKLQPIDVTNYRDERLANIKPSSFAREFGILRHALKIAKVEWGWWQRIDSSERRRIRLNNAPNKEMDYSALHVILAYAKVNEDYWKLTDKDPYSAPIDGVENQEHIRNINKLFFLLSLNASNEKSLYKAFRSELDYKEYPYSFPDKVLAKLLKDIKLLHPKIAHLICSGAGLELMNKDSQMVEFIIKDFVKTNTPILTIHDSFIVPFGEEDRLLKLMKEAFSITSNMDKIKVKFNQNITKKQLFASQHLDRDFYLDTLVFVISGSPSDGYKQRMKKHYEWAGAKID